ncbi:hypothetical protein STEG23_018606, partial [Scotinomys teguina]
MAELDIGQHCQVNVIKERTKTDDHKPYSCSFKDCTEVELVAVICPYCEKNFCLRHRHQSDHGCEKLEIPKPRMAATQKLVKDIIDNKAGGAASKGRKGAKSSGTAAKVALMKLKVHADGDESLPQTERIYFQVYLPKGSKEKSKAMFFCLRWSIGKVVDFAASLAGLRNENNKLTAKAEETVVVRSRYKDKRPNSSCLFVKSEDPTVLRVVNVTKTLVDITDFTIRLMTFPGETNLTIQLWDSEGAGLPVGATPLPPEEPSSGPRQLSIAVCSHEKMSDPWQECMDYAVILARRAGEMICEALKNEMNVMIKSSPADLVTVTDQKVEKMLLSSIKEKYPSHSFIGEESVAAGEKTVFTDNPTWIIDPIDGTTNFVHRFPFVAVSIGFVVNKQMEFGVVYSCVEDKMYTGRKGKGAFCNGQKLQVSQQEDISKSLLVTEFGSSRKPETLRTVLSNMEKLCSIPIHGIRSVGTAAVNMCLVATGGADAYYEMGIHCWDMAGAGIIVTEAGGVLMDVT